MSGIAGFWNINGDPAEEKVLERMVSAIAHRGPHGRGMHVSGPVAIGHVAFHETPESVNEQQPWSDEPGTLWLAVDGRVDNREELAAAIESEGRRLRNDSDAELILRAYQIWGESCAAHIVGDYGFVVWDGAKQILSCARDYIGIRPFLYYFDGGRFIWASEPVGLLAHPDVPKRPNEGMIAEFLAPELASKRETLYEGIFRLEAGHSLTVDRHGVRQRRYWDPESIAPIEDLSSDEYVAGFLDVLKTATASHLRSLGRPGIFLSGGLDSSSLACTASRFQLARAGNSVGLKAYSLVFPGEPYDESRYIDEVVAQCGINSFRVTPKPMAMEWYERAARRSADFPTYPNGSSSMFIGCAAEFADTRAIICGVGGDELLNGNPKHYAALFAAGQFGRFLWAIRKESEVGGEALWRLALRYAVKPLLPNGLRRSLDEIRFGHSRAGWIRPEFATRLGLAQRLRFPASSSTRPQGWQDRVTQLFGAEACHRHENEDQRFCDLGVVGRYPYLDRRVVEFSLRLPENQLWSEGLPKQVLRGAMRDVLPEVIRCRTDKGWFDQLFADTLRGHGGEQAFERLSPLLLEALQMDSLGPAYQQMVADIDQDRSSYMWALWRIHGINLWMKAVF